MSKLVRKIRLELPLGVLFLTRKCILNQNSTAAPPGEFPGRIDGREDV
jgi:hypothetical protein